jgi:hypothetical protein
MRLDVYLHFAPSEPDPVLSRILQKLCSIEEKQEAIMPILDDIVAKVAALTTVGDSVIALLTELRADLDEAIANGDLVKLQAISDGLGAETTRLADAVVANTPVEP